MTTTDSRADSGAGSSSSRWTWLLPVLTFLAGCLLGGLVVAAGALGDTDNDTDRDAGAQPTATPSPDGGSEPSPRPTDLVVTVPQSCLDAADTAAAFARQVDDVVAAVRDLNARRLQEIVDEIQQSQPEVQRLAEQCRSVAGERLQDGQLATPTPGPSPTS